MIARWTFATAVLALSVLGCDGVLDLRPIANDPDAGAAGVSGASGRGGAGAGGSGTAGASGRGGTIGGGGTIGRGGTIGGGGAGTGGSGPAGRSGRGGATGGGGTTGGRCQSGLVAYYPFDDDTKDHSGGGRDIVATDVSPAPGVVGNAFAFNGTSSSMRVTGGADLMLGERTLCAWVRPDSVVGLAQPVFAGGSVGQGDVFSLTSSTPTTPAASCMGSREGQLFVDHGGSCAVGVDLIAPSGQWSFVCWLFVASRVEPLFVNTIYYVAQGSSYTYPVSTLTIGSSSIGGSTTGPAFSGVIDEVTIWDRALSPPEENALWNNSFPLNCGTPSTTCRTLPLVNLTPGTTPPLRAGDTAQFDLSVTNTDNPSCGLGTFHFFANIGFPLLPAEPSGQLALAPGETGHVAVHVGSDLGAQTGSYPFSYLVTDDSGTTVVASASYVIGSTRVSTGIPLVPDGDGHFDGSNAAGVVGYWWSTGDDYGKDSVLGSGDCRAGGFPAEACSVLTTPTPGTFFRPDPGGRGMCTSGVSARVIPDATGAFAWSAIWGNMIAFELANPGTFGSLTMRTGYDAPAHGITGFAFDIDAVPAGGHMRVNFATVPNELNAAYWKGAAMDMSPVLGPGHYEMRWSDIGGPFYLSNPPPFDPTQLMWISFFVFSNNTAPVPFSFCVNNLMLLTN